MQEHQNTKGAPFTIEVFHIARNGRIVGRSFHLKCSTCGKEQTKDVESLNSLHLQDALKGSSKNLGSTPAPMLTPTSRVALTHHQLRKHQ